MGAALREHIKGYGGTGRRGRRPLQRNLQNMRRGGRLCPARFPIQQRMGGRGRTPPLRGEQDDFHKNVIPRSEATWESVFPCVRGAAWGYYGLPHQPAGWFAMTWFMEMRRMSAAGCGHPALRRIKKRNSAGQRSPFSDCIILRSRRCPRCGGAAPRRGCCSRP